MVAVGCHQIMGMGSLLTITSESALKKWRSAVVILTMIVAGACLFAPSRAGAQLGASEEGLSRLLGKPVKKSGHLCYYHRAPNNFVAHLHKGVCDQICIFSDKEAQGFPVALTDDELGNLLRDFGGGNEWLEVGRLSLNRVWNSRNGTSFAIYETMHNKLVMMTRDAYRREKNGRLEEKAM